MTDTLFTGKHLIHLREMPSTNTYAAQLLANSSPIDGTVILTDEQVAGKGQKGNTWYSEKGHSLTFSIIYKTNFLSAIRQFDLSIAVSLGVVEAMQRVCPGGDWSIKWPNDILAGNRKVSGILIENTIQGSHLGYSIVGVGINVNQLHFPDTMLQAASMAGIAGRSFDTQTVLAEVLGKIEAYFLQLRSGGEQHLREKYHGHLYGYSKERNYKDKIGDFSGIIKGVNERGQLLVMKPGELCAYNMQEISWLGL